MLRETISLWNEAVLAYDKEKYEEALGILSSISEPTAKILFNIGCIQLTTGSPNKAFEVFGRAIGKDEHLSVGHFQHGVAALKVNRVSIASESFQKSYLYLRGNAVIDYRQLGLPVLLYKSQVLINIAVCLFRQNKKTAAKKCLTDAMGFKSTPALISALTQASDCAQNHKEFPIQELPVSAIFRPSKSIVSNLDKRDFLGKAKVIASIDQNDTFTGFIRPKTKHNIDGNVFTILNNNELRHSRSLDDLAPPDGQLDSNPRGSADFDKSRPPPPSCPPPRLPNRKIVCIQKSNSLESMLDNDELSSLHSLKMSNNVKTEMSSSLLPESENNETSSHLKIRSEAPLRPPPVYHSKTQLLSKIENEANHDSKTVLPATQTDNRKNVNTAETSVNNIKMTPKVIFAVPRCRELKPPSYPPPKRDNLGNGHLNSERKSPSMVARYNFDTSETGQLSFMEGEIISVQENIDESWFKGRLRGVSGLVPWSYVQPFVRKSVFH